MRCPLPCAATFVGQWWVEITSITKPNPQEHLHWFVCAVNSYCLVLRCKWLTYSSKLSSVYLQSSHCLSIFAGTSGLPSTSNLAMAAAASRGAGPRNRPRNKTWSRRRRLLRLHRCAIFSMHRFAIAIGIHNLYLDGVSNPAR